jgi:hypothetical protein
MQPRTHWLAGSTLSRRASQWCSLLQAISGNQTELVDRTADKQKAAMYFIVGGNLCLHGRLPETVAHSSSCTERDFATDACQARKA